MLNGARPSQTTADLRPAYRLIVAFEVFPFSFCSAMASFERENYQCVNLL